MATLIEEEVLVHLQELRRIIKSANGKLIKSKISPQDYFVNLSHDAPVLKYPDVGISKVVVNICELISTLLLEDIDESISISKAIVMIFEYYFLVSPVNFKDQGPRFVNDITFMKQFLRYIKSLCGSRVAAQRELGNIIAAMENYDPLEGVDC